MIYKNRYFDDITLLLRQDDGKTPFDASGYSFRLHIDKATAIPTATPLIEKNLSVSGANNDEVLIELLSSETTNIEKARYVLMVEMELTGTGKWKPIYTRDIDGGVPVKM